MGFFRGEEKEEKEEAKQTYYISMTFPDGEIEYTGEIKKSELKTEIQRVKAAIKEGLVAKTDDGYYVNYAQVMRFYIEEE